MTKLGTAYLFFCCQILRVDKSYEMRYAIRANSTNTVVYVGLTDPHCGELSLCAEVITSAFLFLIFPKRY